MLYSAGPTHLKTILALRCLSGNRVQSYENIFNTANYKYSPWLL